MIPKASLRSFEGRARKDFRSWKKLTNAKLERKVDDLPIHPPIWSKLSREQKICFLLGAIHKRFGFLLDCVAGETLIETGKGPKRIDELAEAGQPITVWSNTATGVRLVPASCPFPKGQAKLHQVCFASGRSITVTAKHTFLTSRGWISCDELQIGEQLPEFCVDRPSSNSELYPSEYPQGAPRSTRTKPDCPVDYFSDYRHRGEQSQLAASNDLVSSPSQVDFLGRNRTFVHKDDPALLPTSTHHCPASAHLSKSHLPFRDCLDSIHKEYLHPGSGSKSFVQNTCTLLPDEEVSNLLVPTAEDLAWQQIVSDQVCDRPLDSLLAFCQPSYDTVTSIKYVREDVYYDLHVPIHQNYIAHGYCNHNTGMGKTMLSIALARYFWKLGENRRTLIIVPNKINVPEWAREIRKHSPKSKYVLLEGSTAQKWKALEDNPDALFVVCTAMGFVRMVCQLKKKRGKGKKRRLRPAPNLIKKIIGLIDGLIIDESNKVQNKTALPFRISRAVSKQIKFIFLLSGTPFGRDPTSLWAQIFLIDNGFSLGETLGLFRASFFNTTINYWGGYQHKFIAKEKPRLHQYLAHCTIRFKADESTLPNVVYAIKYVDLPDEAQAYYEAARDALIAAHGNYREMKNGFIRMRQISSGFLGYYDDELGQKAQSELHPKPKLEATMDLIETIDPEYKVLLFHDFIFTGSILARELKAHGIGFVQLKQGVKDHADLLHRFDHDPKCQVFILSTAGAYGLNLQVARYGIFYESPTPVITRKQMMRRFERQYSQHKTVFLYDMVTRGTVDGQILKFHAEGKALFDAIIEGKATPR